MTSSILQPEAIDITTWQLDENHGTYPEGARSKRAIFPPEQGCLPFIQQGRRYLYKRSDKRYPEQFWAEVVAYLVGGVLDVRVPPAFVAFDPAGEDCGALIEWFYEDGKAQFFAGGHYMQRLMPDYDRKRGKQHNFHSIQVIMRRFSERGFLQEDWQKWWCEAFLFDALIGNSDRHQDNWGILAHRNRNNVIQLSLAPLFDNGTSLGHELETARVAEWHNDQLTGYIRRGKHHAKWLKSDDRGCGHLEVLQRLDKTFPRQMQEALQKLKLFDVAVLSRQLEQLTHLKLSVPLTEQRKDLYIKLIASRRTRILEAMP